jgi:uncharacterized protein YceK
MKTVVAISIFAALLASGCSTIFPHRQPASVTEELCEMQNEIVLRKARKYGVNPNILRAILVVEQQRSEQDVFTSIEVCEWAMENSARIVAHLNSRPRIPYDVFYSYAAGQTTPGKHTDGNADRFAKRANRAFNQIEKEMPWNGTF